MKPTTAEKLLKTVLVFSALAVFYAAAWFVPRFMGHVIYVRPSLSPWVAPMIIYGALIAIPVLLSIALLWQVFGTIPKNEAFSLPNARRFRQIALLAAIDLALVLILAAFLIISGVLPAFIALFLMGATYLGIVSIIVFLVLGGLVQNAADLKQDSDLTI